MQVNEFNDANKTDEEKLQSVKEIINQLTNVTNLDKDQTDDINPKILIDSVNLIQKIINLNISNGTYNILPPVSNLLDSRNTKSWKNLTVWGCIRLDKLLNRTESNLVLSRSVLIFLSLKAFKNRIK